VATVISARAMFGSVSSFLLLLLHC
jgi:hypothetical protein